MPPKDGVFATRMMDIEKRRLNPRNLTIQKGVRLMEIVKHH
jgi:hypothetical protein